MKMTCYILAFYLLTLFIIPCCSFDDCPDDKIEQSADHKTGDEDCGICSPFFTCNSCAGATLSVENNSMEIFLLSTNQKLSGYILSSICDIHYDFWQPPKLG